MRAAEDPPLRFKRLDAREGEETRWRVLVDDEVVGEVACRITARANRGKTKQAGWPQARGRLWRCSVEGAEVTEEQADELSYWLSQSKREKTSRAGASRHLLDAYQACGVPLPEPENGGRGGAT